MRDNLPISPERSTNSPTRTTPSPRAQQAQRKVLEQLVAHARNLVSSQGSARPSANSARRPAARPRVN